MKTAIQIFHNKLVHYNPEKFPSGMKKAFINAMEEYRNQPMTPNTDLDGIENIIKDVFENWKKSPLYFMGVSKNEFIIKSMMREALQSIQSNDRLVEEIKRMKDECQKAIDQDNASQHEIPMGSFNRLVGRLSAYEHLLQFSNKQEGVK